MTLAIHRNYVPDKLLIQKTAIATVEAGMATFAAPKGIAISKIPMRSRNAEGVEVDHTDLMRAFHEVGKRFIERMAVRGYEYYDQHDLHVFGPYPSYDFAHTMRDITEANVAPEHVRDIVEQRPMELGELADYRIFGDFIAVPTKLDAPISYQHDHSASGTRTKEQVKEFHERHG